MANELNILQTVLIDEPKIEQHQQLNIESYLSLSSSSPSELDGNQNPQTIDRTKSIKLKQNPWHVYDILGKFLLKNRFYLTALEFYTELLENGYDLECLREYFSNPTHSADSLSLPLNKETSFILNNDNSVSMDEKDSFLQLSTNQTFDSTSTDNVTRDSEDINWYNKYGSTGAKTNAASCDELRSDDERIAILEFELRKARDIIQELRQTLTYNLTDKQQTKTSDESNGKYQIPELSSDEIQSIIPSELSVRPFEHRALNYLINEYLLTNKYKLTSVTFDEENNTFDLGDWDSMGLNSPRPPSLTQLYRWYYYQIYINNQKQTTKEDFSSLINFDEDLIEEYYYLKKSCQQTQLDLIEYTKRINQIEKEKENLNEQIVSLQHENKNLLIQLQNHLTLEESIIEFKTKDTRQIQSLRHLPESYRYAFEHELLSYEHIEEENHLDNDDNEQKIFDNIIHELKILSLDQQSLFDLLIRTITKMNSYLNGSKKLNLIPLIIHISILHSKVDARNHSLETLFNLYEKPTNNQRQVILHACLYFAKQTGPLRVYTELLPQCRENFNHKHDEQRCLVAEVCGILTPYIPQDIRVSLIFSMLQQMLVEDECEQVRSACCKSLAMVINETDDESRLYQCRDLFDLCLTDTFYVFQSARHYLLSSIAIWCLELNQVYQILIEHYLVKIELLIQNTEIDNLSFLPLIYIFTDLIVFIFASALKSMTTDNNLSQDTSSIRTLPDEISSEIYQLHVILSPYGEKLLHYYDQYAINGEFPFSEQVQTYLEALLKRLFDTMAFIDIMNEDLVHACSEFIKIISRYFGKNFWKLNIKPIYFINDADPRYDEIEHRDAPFVLYATGILCSWTTEKERAELNQYLYDALLLAANEQLSIDTLQTIYTEIGSDINFQDTLLNVLRDFLTNTNSQVRLYTLQLFNCILPFVDYSIISHKILPSLITLGFDDDITVRTATIPAFGSILAQCSQPEILERVYIQFQMFDSDTTFRDEHQVQSEFIKTFTRIAAHVDNKFREDFILPYLSSVTSQNSQQKSDHSQVKYLEIAIYLFEAYSALSTCSLSSQSILNYFLPGLNCLRNDFVQLKPESIAGLDTMIKDLENTLEQSSLSVGNMNLNQENMRGRMLKGLTNIRDSTEKLANRFIKK